MAVYLLCVCFVLAGLPGRRSPRARAAREALFRILQDDRVTRCVAVLVLAVWVARLAAAAAGSHTFMW
jgi:hypothetical protein